MIKYILLKNSHSHIYSLNVLYFICGFVFNVKVALQKFILQNIYRMISDYFTKLKMASMKKKPRGTMLAELMML